MEGDVNYSGQIYPNDAVGYFRIATGSGRQPVQPVPVGEFLIGSGPECQLRLGDEQIAEIHTRLAVDRGVVLLEVVDSTTPLLINGQPSSEARLVDGDLLELGQFRMLFRMAASENRITLDETSFTAAAHLSDAESLVDQLDEQIKLVEELSHSPNDGVGELLQAIANAQTNSSNAKVSSELTEVKELIQRHHEASRIRLESLTEVLNNVVHQQKLIADTLEVLSERVQRSEASGSYTQRKAS